MKVGTDGVLLGAWCTLYDSDTVLDIGSGTGLISLMLAQRGKGVMVDGIEIDPEAVIESQSNVDASPFASRVNIRGCDWREFPVNRSYDLAVCNPPFFKGNSHDARSMARQDESMSAKDIFEIATSRALKRETGRLAMIIPADRQKEYAEESNRCGLFVNRRCEVLPTPESMPKRVLLEFSFAEGDIQEESLIIEENGRHQYSQQYKDLTADFYL